jgi:hypothetical protein
VSFSKYKRPYSYVSFPLDESIVARLTRLQATLEADEQGIANIHRAGQRAKEKEAQWARERGLLAPMDNAAAVREPASDDPPHLVPKEECRAELPVVERDLDELEQQITSAEPAEQRALVRTFLEAIDQAFGHRVNLSMPRRPVIERVERLRKALAISGDAG